MAASISIDPANDIRDQTVRITRVGSVMFELPSVFIKAIKTATTATQPEITPCIPVNAVNDTSFAEGVFVFWARNIMSDLPRLSIKSIQGARGEPYPQNTIGIFINRGDLARGETVGVAGAMLIKSKLLLLGIEDVKPLIFGSHPQHAAPILID